MKKLLISIPLLLVAFISQAQYVEAGLQGGVDSFWLLNTATSAANNSQTKNISVSYNGGLHLAFDITDNIGIETNVMYASLSQTYKGNFNSDGELPNGQAYVNGESYSSKTTLTETEIPLLLCLETNSGSFIELGAQYDMINGANYNGSFTYPASYPWPFVSGGQYSVANYFTKSNLSGVFGIGGKYYINDYFYLFTDFRITYSFQDIRGVDGAGQDYNSSPYYANPKPTTAVNGSFNFGAFFLIPVGKDYKVGHRCKGSPKVRSGTSHPK